MGTAFKGNVRYSYAGEVASLRSSDEEIVSSGQCLSITDGMGKRLRETDKDDKDKIRYRLKLSRNNGTQQSAAVAAGAVILHRQQPRIQIGPDQPQFAPIDRA